MPGGRPLRLTDKLQDDICAAIKTNVPMHWACRYAGVSDETIRLWRKRATAAEKKRPSARSQNERRILAFFGALDEAQAAGVIRAAGQIAVAAGKQALTTTVEHLDAEGKSTGTTTTTKEIAGDWRASLAMLERTHPEFALRGSMEITGPDGGPLLHAPSNDEVWKELEEVRSEIAAERAAGGIPTPDADAG